MSFRRAASGLALCLASLLPACGAAPEVIIETTAGHRVTAEEIDADPWALLPSGAVTWAEVDAQKLFAAQFGGEAASLLQNYLPLAQGSGIDPVKDIDRIHVGVYATVGADVAVVARGRFDRAAIAGAIEKNPVATGNRPISVHGFAGFDVYVVDDAAMVPVTDSTMVFGSEIGVRRVLERIEEGRIKRALPPWYEEMLAQPAAFSIGVDLDAQPVPATVRTRLTWLEGLRAGRLLGNFEKPGMNLAGTLTYDQPASATKAAAAVEEQVASLDRYQLIMSVLQVPRPIRRLEARPTGKNTQVVAEIDGRAIAALLARSDQLIGQLVE